MSPAKNGGGLARGAIVRGLELEKIYGESGYQVKTEAKKREQQARRPGRHHM